MQKGEWKTAIQFYKKSLEAKKKLNDPHAVAVTLTNLGHLHLKIGQPEKSKPLLARAHLAFEQLGAPETAQVDALLVQACGSVDAARVYLAKFVKKEQSEEAGSHM
jgi:tetratricopeptide (TPR) repeat protein